VLVEASKPKARVLVVLELRVLDWLVGTPGGGRKKQTGGRSSRKFTQNALADTTTRGILAGMPNMSKIPTLEEWKALLQDEIEDADIPAEGTSPHSPEGQMTGSHTSVVTSSSGPQKVIIADTRMEIKAREPLPRSGQPGGNIEAGKSAGGPMVSTPLYRVGQGTNSNIQDVEEAQEARGSLERGTKPPSTLGTANPQSPSTGDTKRFSENFAIAPVHVPQGPRFALLNLEKSWFGNLTTPMGYEKNMMFTLDLKGKSNSLQKEKLS
jgi:hypothetical protein